MNANKFYDILKMIQFPDIDDLNPNSLEWIVDEHTEFFEWLCDTVDERNVLTPEEVVKKEALDAATEVANDTDYEKSSVDYEEPLITGAAVKNDSLNSEISNIEQKKIKKQMEAVKYMQDVMRGHHLNNNLEEKRKKAELMYHNQNNELQFALNQNASVNEEMAEAVEKLQSTIKLLEEGLSKCELDLDSNRFIHLHINEILSKENQYNKVLENYLKLQFPNDLSPNSLHENAPIEAKSADQIQLQAEAEFLHLNLIKVHNKWLTEGQINVMDSAKQTALKSFTKSLVDGTFPNEVNFREKLSFGQKKLDELKKKINPLQEKASLLISQFAKVLAESVFTDGYELKCARQSYFLKKMDKVIEQLVHQNTNLGLFSWLCTIEYNLLKDVNDCLENLHKHLEELNLDSKKRMDAMEKLLDIYPKLTPEREFQSFCKKLSGNQSSQTNHLKNICGRFGFNILSYLEQLKNEERNLKENMKSNFKNQIQNLDETNQIIQNLQHVIWRDTPSFSMAPSIYPKSVLDGIKKMSNDIERDANFLTAIEEDYKRKRNQLEYDDALRLKRQQFFEFYTNEKLSLV